MRLGPATLSAAVTLALPLGLLAAPAGSAALAGSTARAAEPEHSLRVMGKEVGSYPSFDPAVHRYAATTTAATGGRLTVAAASSEPGARVYVDGVLELDGRARVTGLEEGDEVTVWVDDSAGRAAYSIVYLPVEFPEIEVTATPEPGAVADGKVLLTLDRWTSESDSYEVAMDRQGVPAWVRATDGGASMDLKEVPGGYSIFRQPTTSPGRTGSRLVRLDEQFREVAAYETVGLVDTDGHDVAWQDDGSAYLMAYEPDDRSGEELTGAVLQHLSAEGEVLFEWDAADHVDRAVEGTAGTNPDWAHVNSVEVMDDGDLLVSFRHLSAVLKIARTAHDGFAEGDVVWRLGGRRSDWSFPDDEAGTGPCAQHTAAETDSGSILLFDNGSASFTRNGTICVDQADPDGPTVPRLWSRVTEYELDAATGEARTVFEHRMTEPSDHLAIFAGSSQRLANGNTLVGWAAERRVMASEVGTDGEVLWSVRDASNPTDQAFFSYRAALGAVRDATPPTVEPAAVAVIGLGAELTVGALGVRCTDRGGAGLVACEVGEASSDEPGSHRVDVTATDAAGLTSTSTVSYRVRDSRADAAVGPRARDLRGEGTTGSWRRQKVRTDLRRTGQQQRLLVRLRHDAGVADRVAVSGTGSADGFKVRYRFRGEDVTGAVRLGTWRSPAIEPGGHADLKVVVRRRGAADAGDRLVVKVDATAGLGSGAADHVGVVVRAR